MLFYAPRGILPVQILEMRYAERAILRLARSQYYEEMVTLIQAGIAKAFTPPEEEQYGET